MARVSLPTNGAAIRSHRQMAGWNSGEFAKHIGIAGKYLSSLECGRSNASPAVLKRIADALDIKVRDLIKVEPAVPV